MVMVPRRVEVAVHASGRIAGRVIRVCRGIADDLTYRFDVP